MISALKRIIHIVAITFFLYSFIDGVFVSGKVRLKNIEYSWNDEPISYSVVVAFYALLIAMIVFLRPKREKNGKERSHVYKLLSIQKIRNKMYAKKSKPLVIRFKEYCEKSYS
ncbi:hypothetical protein EOPP23_21310 [Endozoicomonas sp. OPT23]|nr:hypothetical protein [Endozoicomonas sp. OPT23]